MKAVRFHEFGGPEVLRYEDVPEPEAGPGEAVVKLGACGVNFIDTYQRTGAYKVALLHTAGQEGAGEVVAVGEGVETVVAGDRVAFSGTTASYAEMVRVSAARLVKLPDGVDDQTGAAVLLQGMTAHFLATSHVPAGAGARLPRTRGCGRRRLAAYADRQDARRESHRHRLDRGEGGAGARGRGGTR